MKTLQGWIREAQALYEQKQAQLALLELQRQAVEEQVTAGLYDLILNTLGLEIAENAVIEPEFSCTPDGEWVFRRGVATFGFRLLNGGYLVRISIGCEGNQWSNDPSAFTILNYHCNQPYRLEYDFTALLLALVEHDAAQAQEVRRDY